MVNFFEFFEEKLFLVGKDEEGRRRRSGNVRMPKKVARRRFLSWKQKILKK